jgi:hypothetical protein
VLQHKAFFCWSVQVEIQVLRIHEYKTIVFDCDGVVLNSNKTKVQAYYAVAKKNGWYRCTSTSIGRSSYRKG